MPIPFLKSDSQSLFIPPPAAHLSITLQWHHTTVLFPLRRLRTHNILTPMPSQIDISNLPTKCVRRAVRVAQFFLTHKHYQESKSFNCRQGIRIVTNGGGINPSACVAMLQVWINIRAHNLCHNNRQLIVFAINRNHSASKNNCN